jgi:malic enzyme
MIFVMQRLYGLKRYILAVPAKNPIFRLLSETTSHAPIATITDDGMDRKIQRNSTLVKKYGVDIINDPLLNKGTSFPLAERDRLGIRGLLPPRELSLDYQVQRVLTAFRKVIDPLEKWQFLTAVQDRNETLFYRLLINNIEEMAPIVYTPTVGVASRLFSHIYRRQRGMYFSIRDRCHMRAMVHNWPHHKVDIIVVTDGSRILGLGDLGVHGMAIPIGKLALYVAAGGVDPARILPVTLDVGTNNPELLNDPLYLGLQQRRVTGSPYYEMVDEFMEAVTERWPNVLVQFEDFENEHARPLLDRYRRRYLCFNDDIQGTGAMVVAGVLSALRAQQKSTSAIKSQRIVCVGAGSAALGVADSLHYAMVKEGASELQSYQNFWLVDQYGLLGINREQRTISSGISLIPLRLTSAQRPYVRSDMEDGLSLIEVVRRVRPTILLGLCGVPGIFSEEIIRDMAAENLHPIIFPLSNPADKAECTALEAFTWTDGRAIFASGSPFELVRLSDHRVYQPNQGNNMYIFPAVGFAAAICKAVRVTDSMFYAAAVKLSNIPTAADHTRGIIYPRVNYIRDVSRQLAIAVCRTAYEEGLAREPLANYQYNIEKLVDSHHWSPEYSPIIYRPG